MLRAATAFLTAIALLAAQTTPSFALDWRRSAVWSDARMQDGVSDRELYASAYLRVPFARTSDKQAFSYGLGITSRVPKSRQFDWTGREWGEAPVVDLGFSAHGFEDLRLSGIGIRQTERRLRAAGDAETSIWWTLGVMIGVGLAAAAIVVFAEGDGNTDPEPAP